MQHLCYPTMQAIPIIANNGMKLDITFFYNFKKKRSLREYWRVISPLVAGSNLALGIFMDFGISQRHFSVLENYDIRKYLNN